MTLSTAPPSEDLQSQAGSFRIGFITPPFKDNKIPVTDHLHAHAFIGPPDLVGWWRGVAYSPVAWYAIDDLIAEIRCALAFLGTRYVGVDIPLSGKRSATTVSSLDMKAV